MKATGIVRRIDDLGRVVIPKEIRRTMRIREGDPLEIYTEADGEVIFKKYSPIGELGAFSHEFAEILCKVGGLPIVICDRDHVTAVSGISKKELLERRISDSLESLMTKRKSYTDGKAGEKFMPIEGVERAAVYAVPVIASGDVCGAVIAMENEGKTKPDEAVFKLIQASAMIIGRQMEE